MFNLTDIEQQRNYEKIAIKLRSFFQEHGFTEVYCQGHLSILAACEDPETIAQFVFGGINYPLIQTNQMSLEKILLTAPAIEKVFCFTTSYRNESFPIEGRHDKIFPMFEFEALGDIDKLDILEVELLWHLGFKENPTYQEYNNLCHLYQTDALIADHETLMQRDFGDVISLSKFPQRSHPFWNMKKNKDGTYNKIDVILYGMETIGSAERSCNPEEMRHNFMNISEGKYAKLLFAEFGQERVLKELESYLALPMIPRFGGGIGLTRLARAYAMLKVFNKNK